jgi:hypothetical protein
MRRFALLCLVAALPGCDYIGNPYDGFGGFIGDTHSVYRNPNRPVGDSENLRRVTGRGVNIDPLLPEPGNVWPGPTPQDPTLADIERSQNSGQPLGAATAPATTDQPVVPHPQPRPYPPGSSTPPTAMAPVPPVAPLPRVPAPAPTQAPPPPLTVQTPQGPARLNPGSGGVQTYTPATGGGMGIVVPNGNGTSTLIGPDGSVQTVPSPR